jgi:acetolactate synthase I/II/III large subunit
MIAEHPHTESKISAGASRWFEMPADRVSEALVASMKLNGLDRIWFVSGSELSFFQEASIKNRALGKPAPQIMTMTHENAALAAASAETVITGKPSSAVCHVECGLMNAGGAIHNASRGHYPVLLMSGYPPSADGRVVEGGRNSAIQWYQQIRDQGELVRQYMKWDHKLAGYDNAGAVITRAFQVMLSEPRGPAYMALPREVTMQRTETARFPLLDQLRPAVTAAPDPTELRQAAKWLLAANHPVICTSAYGRNPQAVPALLELAETLGAELMADVYRMTVPGRHLLGRGDPSRGRVSTDTDCMLLIDSIVPWDPETFDPSPETKIIRFDLDPIVSMTPIYFEFPCDLPITADSAKAVPALLAEIKSLMTPDQKRRCEARREMLEAEGRRLNSAYVEAAESDRAKGHITSRWLSHQLGETLDPEVIMTHELCDSSGFNRSLPGTLIGTGGSSIGWAAPAAVGAKTAAPDRPVVCALGDGSWMFGNPQVTTWASEFHKAPVLFVIYNNRGYRTGTHELVRAFPEGYAAKNMDLTGGWFDPCPNYSAEAAGSGAFGEKVTDPDDLAAAIKRGLKATEEGVPAVLDVWLPKLVTGEL